MAAFITHNDILRAYPRATHDQDVVSSAVLDAAFDVVLHAMHTHDLFRECGLTFKGGTALRKCVIGPKGRFSFDLDFDTTEAPDAVAEIVGEVVEDASDETFKLTMVERRGHQSILVESDLLPDRSRRAKIDFSQRGQCLPSQPSLLKTSPVGSRYSFGDFPVPMIALDENIAEKLSRWRGNPLVRDLFDLTTLANKITDPERVASMYVLKSYLSWVDTPPNRRLDTPAGYLTDTLKGVTPATFVLEDLVVPSAPSDPEKNSLINRSLQRLVAFFDLLDHSIRSENLQRFATNTDGNLAYEAQKQLDDIGVVAGLSGTGAPSGRLHSLSTRALGADLAPEVQHLSSTSGKGPTCGVRNKTGGRCGNPLPPVGGECAAGHPRRR